MAAQYRSCKSTGESHQQLQDADPHARGEDISGWYRCPARLGTISYGCWWAPPVTQPEGIASKAAANT